MSLPFWRTVAGCRTAKKKNFKKNFHELIINYLANHSSSVSCHFISLHLSLYSSLPFEMTASHPWHLTPWNPFFPLQSPYVATSTYVLSFSYYNVSPLLKVPVFSLEAFNTPGIFLSTILSSLLSLWHHPNSLYQPYATCLLPYSYAPGPLYYLLIILPSHIPKSSSQSVSLPPDLV